jgi:hypothetical protein
MKSHCHLSRSLGLALGALAIASAPAPAMPVDRAVGPTAQEQQVLASRGMRSFAPSVGSAKAEHSKGAGRSRQVERLRQIEKQRLRALVDADVAVAGPLIASDFELINPIGEVLSREDLLGGVGSGALDFLSNTVTSQIRVRLHGNTAVLRYRHMIDITVVHVGHLTHPAWTTASYERREGNWQIVWEQTGAIGPLPLPS